jgi:16S rRNA G966 N2-methylase RsmD
MSKFLEEFSLSQALRFRIGNDGKLYGYISHSSGEFYVAPEVLSILCEVAISSQKLEMKNLAKKLGQQYKNILENLPDSAECEAILNDLMASGFVICPQKNVSRYLQEDGFGNVWIQWAMLADAVRTKAYEKAIQNCIDKNSVVVDVGAGTGFLTAACLKAGAQKVIAIEETKIAQKIIPLLNELKLPTQKERLTVLNKNSFDVSLPAQVTHIVSELFGNDPFQEGVIPTLRNMAKNFSKQPVYIPQKIAVYFELIDIIDHPVRHRIKALFDDHKHDDFLAAAKKLFHLDKISFPVELSRNSFKRVEIDDGRGSIELGQMPLNPPPVYTNKKSHPLFGQKKIKVTEKASCLAALLWFRVYITDTITISSHPQEKDAAEHWSPLLFVINKSLHKNEEFTIQYGLDESETQLQCEQKK